MLSMRARTWVWFGWVSGKLFGMPGPPTEQCKSGERLGQPHQQVALVGELLDGQRGLGEGAGPVTAHHDEVADAVGVAQGELERGRRARGERDDVELVDAKRVEELGKGVGLHGRGGPVGLGRAEVAEP